MDEGWCKLGCGRDSRDWLMAIEKGTGLGVKGVSDLGALHHDFMFGSRHRLKLRSRPAGDPAVDAARVNDVFFTA